MTQAKIIQGTGIEDADGYTKDYGSEDLAMMLGSPVNVKKKLPFGRTMKQAKMILQGGQGQGTHQGQVEKDKKDKGDKEISNYGYDLRSPSLLKKPKRSKKGSHGQKLKVPGAGDSEEVDSEEISGMELDGGQYEDQYGSEKESEGSDKDQLHRTDHGVERSRKLKKSRGYVGGKKKKSKMASRRGSAEAQSSQAQQESTQPLYTETQELQEIFQLKRSTSELLKVPSLGEKSKHTQILSDKTPSAHKILVTKASTAEFQQFGKSSRVTADYTSKASIQSELLPILILGGQSQAGAGTQQEVVESGAGYTAVGQSAYSEDFVDTHSARGMSILDGVMEGDYDDVGESRIGGEKKQQDALGQYGDGGYGGDGYGDGGYGLIFCFRDLRVFLD